MGRSTPRRHYHSPERRAQADATRKRILTAAARLFEEMGYAATTMEAIARAAGVSVATVYLNFSGRAAIVEALAEEIVAAPELSVEQVLAEPDPAEQLRRGAAIICRLNERSWLVTDILRGAHGGDETLERLWRQWQQRHLDAMRRAVDSLAVGGALRSGLSPDGAADILYALAGPDVYRALVGERGWAPERYEAWLFNTASAALLRS